MAEKNVLSAKKIWRSNTRKILSEIFLIFLGCGDIASDFTYYYSIKDNKDINIDTRNSSFAFCIIGSIFFTVEIFIKCITWDLTERDKGYATKALCYGTGIWEDFPMLIILLNIRKETGEEFNTEGEFSYWLAVICLFFKVKNGMYLMLLSDKPLAESLDNINDLAESLDDDDLEIDKNNDKKDNLEIDKKNDEKDNEGNDEEREKNKVLSYEVATIYTIIPIILYFFL